MSLALSADGKQALSSYLDGPDQPVIFWDLEANREINRFNVPGNPWFADRELHTASLAFRPDGKTALFGTVFGSVIYWDLTGWRQINHNVMFSEGLEYVTFSKDGTHALAAGCDGDYVGEKARIRFWKLPQWAPSTGRVAPGDCSPEAPADSDVQDYRIRFLK